MGGKGEVDVNMNVFLKGRPDQPRCTAPRRAAQNGNEPFSFDVPTLCGSCLLMHEVAQTDAVLHGLSSKPAALCCAAPFCAVQRSAARLVWTPLNTSKMGLEFCVCDQFNCIFCDFLYVIYFQDSKVVSVCGYLYCSRNFLAVSVTVSCM
jgi:hypothetical protein